MSDGRDIGTGIALSNEAALRRSRLLECERDVEGR